MRVDPNPLLLLLLMKKQAPLRASTKRLQSLEAADPTIAASSSTEWLEISREESSVDCGFVPRASHPQLPLQCLSKRQQAQVLVCTAPVTHLSKNKKERRVGGTSCGPLVVNSLFSTIDFRAQVLNEFDRRFQVGMPVFRIARVGDDHIHCFSHDVVVPRMSGDVLQQIVDEANAAAKVATLLV